MFKFKEGAQAEIGSEDAFYALTQGGYLKPQDVLEDAEQIKQVNDAAKLVSHFIQACYDNEVIEEC